MRKLKFFAVLAVAIVSTGCLKVQHTLNLKPDGSGTVASVIAISDTFMKQAGAMMSAQGGGSLLPTDAALRQGAAALGPGVRFVSSTPYKAGGFQGVNAVYAFDDVSKLTWNMEKAMTGAVQLPGTDPADKPDPDADIKLAFARAGGSSVLTITMPKVPEPDASQQAQAEKTAKQAESNPQLEAMMKQMLAGLLMEVVINVDGTLVKTDAPYVEGKRIVLLRMDGDALLKSGAGAASLMQMQQQSGNFEAMLAKVPGLKLVTKPQVRVEFR